jgi:hypothetical protein
MSWIVVAILHATAARDVGRNLMNCRYDCFSMPNPVSGASQRGQRRGGRTSAAEKAPARCEGSRGELTLHVRGSEFTHRGKYYPAMLS